MPVNTTLPTPNTTALKRIGGMLPRPSDRLRRIVATLTTFFVGQGLSQLVGFITGFLLVRWLSVDDYAQYGLAFAFQCMIGQIVDLGFTSNIVALAGSKGADPLVMGKFIKASKYFRTRLLILVIPIAFVAFWEFSAKHHWDYRTRLILFATIVVSILFQGIGAWYSAPLLVHRKLATNYRILVGSSLFRLIGTVLLHLAGALIATYATVTNTVALIGGALWTKRAAADLITEPDRSDSSTRKEMIRYIGPQLPPIIFYAFEGQIMTFIISAFGKTSSIAEVTALGRIGQIFSIIGAINGTIVVPYFAKLPHSDVRRRITEVVVAVLAFTAGTTFLAFSFPAPFLWILGSKYSHLSHEIGFLVTNSCIGLLWGSLSSITMARKWITWWSPVLATSTLIVAQICGVIFMNLTTTINVLHFAVILSLVNLPGLSVVMLLGYRRDSKLAAMN